MQRFEDAIPGDNVYSRIKGHGKVHDYPDRYNQIKIAWNDWAITCIDVSGKHNINDMEATVFYSDGVNNYLTERPCKEDK